MPKKKYFLTQAELAKLLKNYGGGYRWTHDKKLSQSGSVTYTDAQNNMLTINQLWDKDTDKPYVMVHISGSRQSDNFTSTGHCKVKNMTLNLRA